MITTNIIAGFNRKNIKRVMGLWWGTPVKLTKRGKQMFEADKAFLKTLLRKDVKITLTIEEYK